MPPPGVTLITPTGNRPWCFSICARYVARQTWTGPIQWIIVDDGDPQSEIDDTALTARGVELLRLYPTWAASSAQSGNSNPPENTLAKNLLFALPEVRHDLVFFIEDDDWYAADYLENQVARLNENNADIVGEAPARYYHVPTRQHWTLNNYAHASLCQTGVRASSLPLLETICQKSVQSFIDVRLWESSSKRFLYPGLRSVGMKGLPGRPGIGAGHRPVGGSWRYDPSLQMLESWIGAEDAAIYRGLLGSMGTTHDENPNFENGIEIFYWKGQKRYKCPKTWDGGTPCQYDTHKLEMLVDHMRATHGIAKPSAVTRVSPILGPEGQKVYVSEPAPEVRGAKFKEED